MRTIKEVIKKNPEYLFFIFSAAGTLGFVLLCLITGNGFDWITMGNTPDWSVTDFSRHVYLAADLKNVYTEEVASFPPLAYLFFFFLYRLNPVPTYDYDWANYVYSPYIKTLYIMLLIITVLAFVYAVQKITRSGTGKIFFLCGLLLCSLPFSAGAIERGNPVFLTLVLILLALLLKDSPSKKNREAALIVLSIAVNFKLYPAVLGLLYIKEERFKEAVRLIIYSVILFFVPFIWVGGVEGIKMYLSNLFLLSSSAIDDYASFMNIFFHVFDFFGVQSIRAYDISSILGHICFPLLLLFAWISNSYWKTLLFLSGIMSYYLPSNYRYTVIFMSIPLIYLMQEINRDCCNAKQSNEQICKDMCLSDQLSEKVSEYNQLKKSEALLKMNPAPMRTPYSLSQKDPIIAAVYMATFGLIFTIHSWCYPSRPDLMMAVFSMTILVAACFEELLDIADKRRPGCDRHE